MYVGRTKLEAPNVIPRCLPRLSVYGTIWLLRATGTYSKRLLVKLMWIDFNSLKFAVSSSKDSNVFVSKTQETIVYPCYTISPSTIHRATLFFISFSPQKASLCLILKSLYCIWLQYFWGRNIFNLETNSLCQTLS